jgi:hypothetical protein
VGEDRSQVAVGKPARPGGRPQRVVDLADAVQLGPIDGLGKLSSMKSAAELTPSAEPRSRADCSLINPSWVA